MMCPPPPLPWGEGVTAALAVSRMEMIAVVAITAIIAIIPIIAILDASKKPGPSRLHTSQKMLPSHKGDCPIANHAHTTQEQKYVGPKHVHKSVFREVPGKGGVLDYCQLNA